MATLRQRLHRKNATGTYDVIHLETESGLVLRSDGTTVEQAITDLTPTVGESVPKTLILRAFVQHDVHFFLSMQRCFIVVSRSSSLDTTKPILASTVKR